MTSFNKRPEKLLFIPMAMALLILVGCEQPQDIEPPKKEVSLAVPCNSTYIEKTVQSVELQTYYFRCENENDVIGDIIRSGDITMVPLVADRVSVIRDGNCIRYSIHYPQIIFQWKVANGTKFSGRYVCEASAKINIQVLSYGNVTYNETHWLGPDNYEKCGSVGDCVYLMERELDDLMRGLQ